MPMLHCLDYFVVSFEIKKCEFSNFVLFQDYFGNLESLENSCEFGDEFFSFCKYASGILMGITLSLDCFDI